MLEVTDKCIVISVWWDTLGFNSIMNEMEITLTTYIEPCLRLRHAETILRCLFIEE